MSLTQVSSAPKTENAIYIGLSLVFVVFFIRTFVPEYLSSDNALFYITLFSSLVAATLYYLKIDRVTDLVYIWLLKSYQPAIQRFIALTDTYLRVWETSPTESIPYSIRSAQVSRTTIKGHDLYGDMWLQKGLVFFMISLGFIAVITYTEFYDRPIVFGLVFDIPTAFILFGAVGLLLAIAGWFRFRGVPSRCAYVTEFRYFQDALNTDFSRRKKSASPQGYWGGQNEVRGPSVEDIEFEYKNALRDVCSEIDKVISRKEWGRFSNMLEQIEKSIAREVDTFLLNESLSVFLAIWGKTMTSNDSKDRICFSVLVSTIQLLVSQEEYAGQIPALPDLVDINIDNLLDATPILQFTDPKKLTQDAMTPLASSLSQIDFKKAEDSLITKIISWLTKSTESAGNMVQIMNFMDPVPRTNLSKLVGVKCDEECVNSLRRLLYLYDFPARVTLIEMLSYVRRNLLSDDDIMSFIDACYDENYDVSIAALDALYATGVLQELDEKVRDVIVFFLHGNDERRHLAAAVRLYDSGIRPLPESILRELARVFSNGKPFLQKMCFQVLGEQDEIQDYSDILWLDIESHCKGVSPKSGIHPTSIVGKLFRSEETKPETPMEIALLLKMRTDYEFLKGNVIHLLEWARKLDNNRHRILKTATFLLIRTATSIAEVSDDAILGVIDRMEPNPPASVETAGGLMLSSLSMDAFPKMISLLYREDWKSRMVLRAFYHKGEAVTSYSNASREIANRLSQSDAVQYALLALTIFGESLQRKFSIKDRILRKLQENDEVNAATASEVIASLGDVSIASLLEQSAKKQRYSWVRRIMMQNLSMLARG